MIPSEQVGAVPQAGVNPLAKNAQPAPPATTAPRQPASYQPSPEDLDFFRNDPEIIETVTKFMGRQIDMAEVPDELLAMLAGMVQKLGVDGAVSEIHRTFPADLIQQIKNGSGGR